MRRKRFYQRFSKMYEMKEAAAKTGKPSAAVFLQIGFLDCLC